MLEEFRKAFAISDEAEEMVNLEFEDIFAEPDDTERMISVAASKHGIPVDEIKRFVKAGRLKTEGKHLTVASFRNLCNLISLMRRGCVTEAVAREKLGDYEFDWSRKAGQMPARDCFGTFYVRKRDLEKALEEKKRALASGSFFTPFEVESISQVARGTSSKWKRWGHLRVLSKDGSWVTTREYLIDFLWLAASQKIRIHDPSHYQEILKKVDPEGLMKLRIIILSKVMQILDGEELPQEDWNFLFFHPDGCHPSTLKKHLKGVPGACNIHEAIHRKNIPGRKIGDGEYWIPFRGVVKALKLARNYVSIHYACKVGKTDYGVFVGYLKAGHFGKTRIMISGVKGIHKRYLEGIEDRCLEIKTANLSNAMSIRRRNEKEAKFQKDLPEKISLAAG